MVRRISLVFIATINISVGICAQGQDQAMNRQICAVEIPINNSIASPLEFRNITFYSEPYRTTGNIEMVNRGKGISDYLVIVELRDKNDKVLISVPIVNERIDGRNPFDVPFAAWLAASSIGYNEDIAPGETVNKPFFSELATLDCPASAYIAMVQLNYDDKTSFRAVAYKLNLQPILLDIVFEAPEQLEHWRGATLSGTITINPAGSGALLDLDCKDSRVRKWLEKEIAAWKFSPAIKNGSTSSFELPFLFSIAAQSNEIEKLELIKQKSGHGVAIVIAAVDPESSFNNGWQIFFGKNIANALRKQHIAAAGLPAIPKPNVEMKEIPNKPIRPVWPFRPVPT